MGHGARPDGARGMLAARLTALRKRLRPLWAKRAVERELDEEMAFHVEMETKERMKQRMSEAEARRAALVAFRGVERYKEEVRRVRWSRWLEDLAADVRYAFRTLRAKPAFTVAIVATLALGIGGTTAIFSVVDGLFLRTPPGVRDAAAVRKIYLVRDSGNVTTPEGGPGSYVDFEALRQAGGFAGVSAHVSRLVDLGRGAEAEQLRIGVVTGNHFDVLRVRPTLGRFFAPVEDDAPGAHPVVVIGHGLWLRRFGGARDVLGRTLEINNVPLTIIGVAERGFAGVGADPLEAWVPMAMASSIGTLGIAAPRTTFSTSGARPADDWRLTPYMLALDYVGRLAPGVADEGARSEAAVALARTTEEFPQLDPTPGVMLTQLTAASGPWRDKSMDLSLWVALVAALVLMIACANVANLLLARSLTRRRELALRHTLGAGGGRIARQMLTESMVLALLGGAAGLLVAHLSAGMLGYFPLPPGAGQTDVRLLGFALGVSVLSGIVFGLLPALRSVRVDPLRGMQDTRVAQAVNRGRTRGALVALQVALSLVLLVGAGLFFRSLSAVVTLDVGVDADRLLVVDADLRKAGFAPAEADALWEQARVRAMQVPGVEDAALVHFAPFIGMSYAGDFQVPGPEQPVIDRMQFNLAGAGYFSVAGVRLIEGREFTAEDATGAATVIVNQMLADAIAPGRNALGACVHVLEQAQTGECSRVIGVVENYPPRYLDEPTTSMVFLPRDRNPRAITWGGPFLVVRARNADADQVAAVRAAISSLRDDLPFLNVRPLAELYRREVLPFKLGAALFGLYSALALVLAAVGLAGVLSYFVSERRQEIGVRRALGAPARGVVSLVVRQGLQPVALGLAAGLIAAFVGTRFLASLLFGIEATDMVSFAGAVGFLLIVAAIAIFVPARRAAAVDPMVVLRQG